MPDSPALDGPGFGPASGGAPRQLVVLLHGWGADGNDLIGLAPPMSRFLPDAEFLSPNGPEPCDANPMGRQWFPLSDMSPDEMLRGAKGVAPAIDAYLDAALAERNLGDDRLALIGFSQGTMMALYVALRRPRGCAAVVGYSGLLIGGETLTVEARSKPPVLLVHGEDDPVVPVAALPATVDGLSAAGVAVEWHRRPRVQHGIDEFGLVAGAEFIATAFRESDP
ncbi:MAG: alpha/beta fold hydrolase [Alphaproteobacteria bacterium]|nr:alpha/beta fold hydrolase [Alphaproteobacteria bacterium]